MKKRSIGKCKKEERKRSNKRKIKRKEDKYEHSQKIMPENGQNVTNSTSCLQMES